MKKENKEWRKEKSSLKEKISKRLLEVKFEKHNSIKTMCLKWIVKKNTTNIIKMTVKQYAKKETTLTA